MKSWMLRGLCLAAPLVALTACPSGRSGSLHQGGIPDKPIATYKTPFCVGKDGAKVAGPPVTYYLTRKRKDIVLLELDEFGQGYEFSDSFVDNNGYNFLVETKEKGKQGDAVQFVIPRSASADGVRFLFPAGTYKPSKSKKAQRIDGEPTYRCDMVNQAGADPAAPDKARPDEPKPETPKSDKACVPGQTQECVGPAACRGGQVCLPDGTAYGPCDCGTAKPPEPASSATPSK